MSQSNYTPSLSSRSGRHTCIPLANLNFQFKDFQFFNGTRDAIPAAKIRKSGLRKVFTVWTKSHFSNFEVG